MKTIIVVKSEIDAAAAATPSFPPLDDGFLSGGHVPTRLIIAQSEEKDFQFEMEINPSSFKTRSRNGNRKIMIG